MVGRLRAAGAIFIGKTNMPEFGLGSHSFNPVYGATANAYDHGEECGRVERRRRGGGGPADAAGRRRQRPCRVAAQPAGLQQLLRPAPEPGGGSRPRPRTCSAPASAVLGAIGRTPADIGLMLSVQAGYDPRCPNAIRQDPSAFASPLARDFRGTRIAWLGDCGGQIPFDPGVLDLGRVGADDLRGDRLHRRGGGAPLRHGAALAGLAGAAGADRRGGAAPALRRAAPSGPAQAGGRLGGRAGARAERRSDHRGPGGAHALVRDPAPVHGGVRLPRDAERRRSSPSTRRCAGPRRSAAGGWIPITAGCRP